MIQLSKRIGLALMLLAAPFQVMAENVTAEALAGQWEFVSWEEADDPGSRRNIGMLMEFKANGEIVNHRSSGPKPAAYVIDGDVIRYTDKKGEQNWKVVEFKPGEGFVVNHMGALMRFERR